MKRKVIVGLGNKGLKYINTRHNVGFMVIDKIAQKLSTLCDIKEKHFYYTKVEYKNFELFLVKPTTYMNLSGLAVKEVLKKANIDVDDLLVIYDDVDLLLGNIRIKLKGGAAGHNGLKSIFEYNDEQFTRLKIGIGGREKGNLAEHVLAKFKKDEMDVLNNALEQASCVALDFVSEDITLIMNKYNQKQSIE